MATSSPYGSYHRDPIHDPEMPDVVEYRLIARVIFNPPQNPSGIGHYITKTQVKDGTYLYNDMSTSRSIAEIQEDFEKIAVHSKKAIEVEDTSDDEIGFISQTQTRLTGISGQSGPASGPSPGRARVWAARARRRAGPGLHQGSGPGLGFRKPGP
ncbi:hypothetical protein GGX14DRAFT_395341 [Mycena pura]|uniref:Uncharacterized protein n=1 Tax=Mycena pura TaxID=153505 RepID=A0AAD6VD67_9AGAR|nr:hypothetical protein GGX14DRAFT_395341 [Mycena pura]